MFRTVCRLVELHHLPTASVHAWEHSDEGIARQLRRAESIAAKIQGAQGHGPGLVAMLFDPLEAFRAGLAETQRSPLRKHAGR